MPLLVSAPVILLNAIKPLLPTLISVGYSSLSSPSADLGIAELVDLKPGRLTRLLHFYIQHYDLSKLPLVVVVTKWHKSLALVLRR
jgi:hypothetical protein